MEQEIVSTTTGRKATRAKAWRVCETGVTYFNPVVAVSAPRARQPRLSPNEQMVLATLRSIGRASLRKVWGALPVRLSNDATLNALRRLVTLGCVIEHEAKLHMPSFRSITYEAVHDPGA